MKRIIMILAVLALTGMVYADNFAANMITINPLGGAIKDVDGVKFTAVGGVSSGQRLEIGLPSGIDANSNVRLLIEITSSQTANGAVNSQFLGGSSLNRNLSDLATYGNGMSINWSSGAKFIILYATGIPAGSWVKIKSVQFLNNGVSYFRLAY